MINIVIPEAIKLPKKKIDQRYELNKRQKMDYFTIPDQEPKDLIKFALISNWKTPARDGHLDLDSSDMRKVESNSNIGMLTGYKTRITVIDVDFYKMVKDVDDHFAKYFKDEIENHFNTFCVSTPSGGMHYYFEYDIEIKQYQENAQNPNPKHVDVRNDRGYVVVPPSSINGSFYETANDVKISEMSPKLRRWLLDNLYYSKAGKSVDKNTKKSKNIDLENNEKRDDVYELTSDSQDALIFLNNLIVDCEKSMDHRGSYSNWIQVMRGFKYAGGTKEDFKKWSKKTIHGNYDEKQLNALWRSTNSCYLNFLYLLKYAGVRNRYSYKKLPDNNFTNFNIYTDKLKLQEEKGPNYFTPDTNYLTLGPPNVGKTFSFRKYACYQDCPFISITSRKTLSYEQYRDFMKEINDNNLGARVHHYEDNDYYPGDSIIITPESSIKLVAYDFSNYIIFMDEFNSIVGHALTSETMENTRFPVFKMLVKMILTCKQFLCVDADISATSKRFLDYFSLPYKFDVFTKSSYEGVEVEVLYDEAKFYDILRGTDVYLFCSDTKKDVDILQFKLKIGHEDLFCITKDTDMKGVTLDSHPRTGISPKVIYGLNSLLQRIVFCHYTGKTINPSQMVQQICRCRNINKVYIYYPDIITKTEKYEMPCDVDETYDHLLKNYNSKIDKFSQNNQGDNNLPIKYSDKNIVDETLVDLFNELYKMNDYMEDCFNTNKFLHLLNILKNRGFVIKNDFSGEIIRANVNHAEIAEELKLAENAEFSSDSEKVKRINEYLKVPETKIHDFKNLFVDKSALSQHFNISSFFFTDEVHNLKKLFKKDDFDILKCKDVKMKFVLLDSLLQKIGLDKLSIGKFIPGNKDFKNDQSVQALLADYKKLIRVRKNILFDTDVSVYKEVCNMYRQLFGITSVYTRPSHKVLKAIYGSQDNDVNEDHDQDQSEESSEENNQYIHIRIQLHEFVPDILKHHEALFRYRNKHNKNKKNSGDQGDNTVKIRKRLV